MRHWVRYSIIVRSLMYSHGKLRDGFWGIYFSVFCSKTLLVCLDFVKQPIKPSLYLSNGKVKVSLHSLCFAPVAGRLKLIFKGIKTISQSNGIKWSDIPSGILDSNSTMAWCFREAFMDKF